MEKIVSPKEKSDKPSQVRIRLRRAARREIPPLDKMKRDVEILYQKKVEDWTYEELAFGRPRNKAGSFSGIIPNWISPVIAAEAKRRLMGETYGDLAQHGKDAIKTIYKLMNSEEVDEKGKPLVDARTRLAAAQFIVEHVLGKPKAVYEFTGEDQTRSAIAAAIVMDDGEVQDHFVLEGEVVASDDDEGEDNARSE